MTLLDNLVAAWKLDGNGTDSSGNGNHLTSNSATFDAGKFGDCFVGTPNAATSLSRPSAALSFGSNPFTVSTWVLVPSEHQSILWKFHPVCELGQKGSVFEGPPSDYGWSIYLNDSGDPNYLFLYLEVVAADGINSLMIAATGVLLTLDEWAHCAVSFDGSNVRMWINGTAIEYEDFVTYEMVPTYPFPHAIRTPSSPFVLGDNQVATEIAAGTALRIDETCIWSIALDNEQVASIYNSSFPFAAPGPSGSPRRSRRRFLT